ncbi:MAG: GGDEF domain-containing response regulator [Thermodesulfobacteriota bacterium]
MPAIPRVLVVDDDPACLRILQKFLEKDGYQVMVAADGASGLAQAQQEKPDLIICDWMMPGLDGPQVCQAIKGNPALKNTFFIFLTALEKSYISEGIAQGADDFITKPIDPVEVGAKVKAGLRLNRAQKDLQDLAWRDELTGLYNRRHWDNALEEACRAGRPFLAVMADVDRFKEINDQWGHRVGDVFLQELARSWKSQLEEPEILARHGGDEFACLYYRPLGSLLTVRNLVEKSLAAAFPFPVGLSLGYARFQPNQKITPSILMAQADRALYEDKSKHRATQQKTRIKDRKKSLLERT